MKDPIFLIHKYFVHIQLCFITIKCIITLFFREEIPPLLLKEANVSSVDELHVSVEDHRYEEYVPSKPKKKIFGGSGHLLGR